jgi:hypothetical protein
MDKCDTAHDDTSQQCIHHWLIDARNLGVCKKCGESKQFCCWWEAASRQRSRGTRSGKLQHNLAGAKD